MATKSLQWYHCGRAMFATTGALAPQRSVLQHHNQPRDVACDSRICYANRQYRQQLVVRSADEVCTARDAKRRYCQFQKAVMTNFVLCRVLCYFLSHRKQVEQDCKKNARQQIKGKIYCLNSILTHSFFLLSLLSKQLYTFYSSENGLNYTLRIVFYVGFFISFLSITNNEC